MTEKEDWKYRSTSNRKVRGEKREKSNKHWFSTNEKIVINERSDRKETTQVKGNDMREKINITKESKRLEIRQSKIQARKH